MFEWLKNLLFEEEEVTIEESEIEEIDFANNRKDIADIIANRSEPKIQKEKVYEGPQMVSQEPAPKSFGIEVEPEAAEKEKKPARPVFSQSVKNTEPKVVDMNVISPMYGGTSEPKDKKKKPIIDTAPKRRSDALGTVISPMYGQSELATHEKEAMKRIEEEKPEVVVGDDWGEDEVKLEEILYTEEENTDCMQFSLFGDDVEKLQIDEEKEE